MKYGILILFLVCSVVGCDKSTEDPDTYCRQLKTQGIVDNYKYPVVPGTPEWEALTNHQDMIDACRIPDDILSNMCTCGLVVTCPNYPLLFDITAYNIPQTGYDAQRNSFNGLAELHRRPDALAELADYYQDFDLTRIKELWGKDSTYEAIYLAMKFYIAGMMLYQDDILNRSDHKMCEKLLEITLGKYDYM